jgi:hypothetical protein
MNDYFQNLAARSLGQAHTLRPVLAPLLGPAAFDTTWSAEAASAASDTNAEAPLVDPESGPSRDEPSRGPVPVGQIDHLGDAVAPEAPSKGARGFLQPADGELMRGHDIPPVMPRAGPEAGSAPRHKPLTPQPKAIRGDRPIATARVHSWRPFAPTALPPVEDSRAMVRPFVVAPAGIVAVPTASRSGSSASQGMGGGVGVGKSEPIVHVTIGRIEVRAVPAPAAPAKLVAKRTGGSSMASLEQYRRRGIGGRTDA